MYACMHACMYVLCVCVCICMCICICICKCMYIYVCIYIYIYICICICIYVCIYVSMHIYIDIIYNCRVCLKPRAPPTRKKPNWTRPPRRESSQSIMIDSNPGFKPSWNHFPSFCIGVIWKSFAMADKFGAARFWSACRNIAVTNSSTNVTWQANQLLQLLAQVSFKKICCVDPPIACKCRGNCHSGMLSWCRSALL